MQLNMEADLANLHRSNLEATSIQEEKAAVENVSPIVSIPPQTQERLVIPLNLT